MKILAVILWAGIVGNAILLIHWFVTGFDWNLVLDLDSQWFLPFLVLELLFGFVIPFVYLEKYLLRTRK